MSDDLLDIFNTHYDREEWKQAIAILRKLLKRDPDDHWLLSRLSSSLYESHRYEDALEAAEKALALAPQCPLAQWDAACALDMLGREEDAIHIWKGLLKRKPEKIAVGDCGEGMLHAEALLNDCRYSIGLSYLDLGKKALARKYLEDHLTHRRAGMPSLATQREVKAKLREAV